MIKIIDTRKQDTETVEQYLWRIGQAVDSGEIESWQSITDVVNREVLGDDEMSYRTESSWRKRYQAARAFYVNCFSKMGTEEHQRKMDAINRELARNTIKMRDQRRSWQKQNYEATRFDEIMDLLEEKMDHFGKLNFAPHPSPIVDGDKSMIICLSDLHIGQCFHSYFGEYNSEIAKQRLAKYLDECLTIARENHVSKAYCFLLGDNISNSLHKTIEVSNKENVIDQLKLSIEYITSFCYELTKHFEHVYLASASGNHTRLQPKDLAQHSERLDAFIAWDVCRFLQHIDNFHSLLHRSIDDGIGAVNIDGKNYLLIHGDYDTPNKNGYLNLANIVGFFPDYVLCGHKHFCFYSQESRFIQSGSLAGSGDDYTIEQRLAGSASQMVCVVDQTGVRSVYPVILT